MRRQATSSEADRSWSTFAWPPRPEAVVVFIGLVLAAGTPDDLFTSLPAGGIVIRLLWVLLYLSALILLTYRHGSGWLTWLIGAQPLLCSVVAFAFLSVLWSLDPYVTMRRDVNMAGATLLGILLGYSFSHADFMRLFFWILTTLVVLSLLSLVIAPEIALESGQLTGLMGNRARLGGLTAVAALYFLVGVVQRRIDWVWGGILIVLSLLGLALAFTATALIFFIGCCGVLLTIKAAGEVKARIAVALLFCVMGLLAAAYVATLYLDTFVEMVGRDPTLSGRTAIWRDALEIVRLSPWLGHGYGTVWGMNEETWLPAFAHTIGRSHAHNGVLHLATELGVIIAAIAAAQVLHTLSNLGRLLWQNPSSGFVLFGLVYLFGFIVMNISEARLFRPLEANWIIYVSLSVAAARLLWRHDQIDQRRRRSRRRGRPKVKLDPATGRTLIGGARGDRERHADQSA